MSRRSRPQSVWQGRWSRARRPVIVLLLVLAAPAAFVSLGLAALLFAVSLGLATFSSGGPTENGPTSPPSVRGTYLG